ncbi:MAG: glycosyltransferase [Candidatus Obscuribacterales bacterium]|nr:glycosyltransferase [Candidatus Obscuribacterales bacterium]
MESAPITFFVSKEIKNCGIKTSADLLPATILHPPHAGEIAHLIQTFLLLQYSDLNCRVSSEIPQEGIIVCHRKSFPADFRPTSKQFLVYAKGDWDVHYYAQLHVIQNPIDMHLLDVEVWPRTYVPHYPQPGLIPRAESRGDTFANIGFVGDIENLAGEVQTSEFIDWLARNGLQLKTRMHAEWHNYSDLDAFLAIREIRHYDAYTISDTEASVAYGEKPATKLFNAWHAGLPAILAVESGYRYHRRSQADYLEVSSMEDIKSAIVRLKENPSLRKTMAENALARSREYTAETIAKHWYELLCSTRDYHFPRWQNLNAEQRRLYFTRRAKLQREFMSRKEQAERDSGKPLLMSYPM